MRTLAKISGRLRKTGHLTDPNEVLGKQMVGLIGCGQFAYTTIGYFITKEKGKIIRACYDIDHDQSKSLSSRYRVPIVAKDSEALIKDPSVTILFIASNHASHTPYAIRGLKRGMHVYVEKPISVNKNQLKDLVHALSESRGKIYAGYNRPFSKAIRYLHRELGSPKGPFTLNCFVCGHVIPRDHWYRKPEEGTRICGNVGHWLDLLIHLLSWRSLPDKIEVQIAYSKLSETDDNIAITLVTDMNDLASIILTSRAEPFGGINETICVQCDRVIARIDSFRSIAIWNDDKFYRKRFWPRDAGHKRAVLQPFSNGGRDWDEVEISTMLMLFIKDMILKCITKSVFSIKEARMELDSWREVSA
jgi:predicted dehydrogenase